MRSSLASHSARFRLLCLSNGHGEDAIAVRILHALQQQSAAFELAALPIVGEGHAYQAANIPVIGSVKAMPSGGFIYMDGRQFARDLRGGLLQLTVAQIKAIKAWTRPLPDARATSSLILAVGDIVPLLFAWLSGAPFAFVGTAKSEYYLRDEAGPLPRQSWFDDRLERWTGCIYHPWERWLMSRPQCKAVFPRDTITARSLQRFGIPAFDAGNPMMDGLDAQVPISPKTDTGVQISRALHATPYPVAPITIALLPGSRPPEAYANWEIILQAVNGLIAQMKRPLILLAAIAPGLDSEKLHQLLVEFRWQQTEPDAYSVGLGEQKAKLILAHDRFAECLHQAEFAIAMAGTATEQFVGLGKPAIIIPGKGPQFTPRFAESQTRLLGPSVTLVSAPQQVTSAVQSLLQNPDRLHLIAENGHRRMGAPGAADRIAQRLIAQLSTTAVG